MIFFLNFVTSFLRGKKSRKIIILKFEVEIIQKHLTVQMYKL